MMGTMELPTRITSKVEVTDTCWLWTGGVQPNGYSYTTWPKKDGSGWGKARVHRLYYEAFIGPIDAELEIDHLCKVRHCVNPSHLRAVTHAENLTTRTRVYTKATECLRGHEYTPENTYWHRSKRHPDSPSRSCKQCARDSH
jgi:hypothetical protein